MPLINRNAWEDVFYPKPADVIGHLWFTGQL